MPGAHPLPVEALPQAEAQRERVEADPLVECTVDSPEDALREPDAQGQ